MPTYTIERVSTDQPREWGEGTNKTYYIKVMLAGYPKAVTIGKKRPDALRAGDTVSGTITETQYDTDKFTADKPAFSGGGKFPPKDEAAIKAMWAIGQAVQLMENPNDLPGIEALATDLFAMVDRVKTPQLKIDDVFGGSQPLPPDDDPFAGMELLDGQ